MKVLPLLRARRPFVNYTPYIDDPKQTNITVINTVIHVLKHSSNKLWVELSPDAQQRPKIIDRTMGILAVNYTLKEIEQMTNVRMFAFVKFNGVYKVVLNDDDTLYLFL